MNEWVTIKEAVGILGMSERTLRRHIAEGKIESHLEGGRRLVYANGYANAMTTDMPVGIQQLLDEKDARIEQLEAQIEKLTSLLAMAQSNVAALTEQLDASRQMIEDLRQPQPLWRRLFRRLF